MKLQELLAKIQEKKGRLPKPEEMDQYLHTFIVEKMPHSETLQEAFDVSFAQMEMLYAEGYAYYEHDALEDAVFVFQWLVILNPFMQKCWMGLGSAAMLLGDYEKALKSFAMAAMLNADDPYPHYYAALCYTAEGNREDRQKALNLALVRAKSDPKHLKLEKKIKDIR